MAFKDVLLQLSSYPEATPAKAIDQAVRIAENLGAHISALALEIEMPNAGNALANAMLDIKGMIAAERRKSSANARQLIKTFDDIATQRGVAHDHIPGACQSSQLAAIVTAQARMHDITIIPVGDQPQQLYVAESVIFGSGRPTMILPEASANESSNSFGSIGVAWDFSRPAARAIADAMPILRRAKSVQILTITQDKVMDTKHTGADLARHLAWHGIEVVLKEKSAAGRPIGQALADYAVSEQFDLLVMGAYGHSRMRDFILGGATTTILDNPPLPVLLSH